MKLLSSKILLAVLVLALCSGTSFAATNLTLWGNDGSNNDANLSTHIQLVYVPGLAVQSGMTGRVSIGATTGTTTFTVTASPAWLSAIPAVSGDTDALNNLTVTATAASLSGMNITGNTSGTITLHPADGSDDFIIPLDLVWVTTPLIAGAQSYSTTYTHGGTAATATANISIPFPLANIGFSLDPSLALPNWLTAAITGSPLADGYAAASVTFTTVPALLNALPNSVYTVPVGLKTTGCASCSTLNFNVVVIVTSAAPTETMTVTGLDGTGAIASGSIARNWSSGSTALPVTVVAGPNNMGFTASCTQASTNQTFSPAGCILTLGSQTGTNQVSGLAGTFGVSFTAAFDPNLLDIAGHQAQYNDTVTLVITVVPNSGQTRTLTYVVTLPPPTAVLSQVSPATTPLIPSGSSLVATLTGQGFVCAVNCIKGGGAATRVFTGTAATGLSIVTGATITAVVNSPGTITLTIPAASLPAAGGKLYLGVMNQPSATPPTWSGSATITITVSSSPSIIAVTNSASYLQYPGQTPKVSPYELVSIFGYNFNTSPLTTATPDPTKDFFANTLTVGGGTLKVGFTPIGSNTAIPAAILFSTPSQINVIVPASLVTSPPTNYNVSVTLGTATSANFLVQSVPADPGIFTLDSSGMGQAAIINNTSPPLLNGPTVSNVSAPATSGTSISIYLTGLGVPNAPTATTNTGTYYTSCITPGAYVSAVTGLTGIDGAVIQSAKLGTGHLPPCFTNAKPSAQLITVTFGCKSGGGSVSTDTNAAGSYAGFVADSVAGLYQVNVVVPAGLTAGDCPLTLTTGTGGMYSSQTTATIKLN